MAKNDKESVEIIETSFVETKTDENLKEEIAELKKMVNILSKAVLEQQKEGIKKEEVKAKRNRIDFPRKAEYDLICKFLNEHQYLIISNVVLCRAICNAMSIQKSVATLLNIINTYPDLRRKAVEYTGFIEDNGMIIVNTKVKV